MPDDIIYGQKSTLNPATLPGSEQRFNSRLNRAIQEDHLVLHYQPRFNSATREADIVEAFVRWQHPTSGLFYPDVFLAAAEKHGLIYNLDLWVFEQCCKDLIWLREHVDHKPRIAVNISVIVCESMYFAQKLISICDKYGLSFSDFEFEITESTHNRDIRKVRAFCETLGQHGATFCLDDFGIGQSSLLNLCMLPVNLIKIDKSFVQMYEHDDRVQVMVQQLVKMAHGMGLQVIAEGIENDTQCRAMIEIGCDQLQGFHLYRPDVKKKLRYTF